MSATVQCDCLNHCGDDPWLKDGRSQPCASLLAEQLREKQERPQAEKVVEICNIYGTDNIADLIMIMQSKIEHLTAGVKV